MNKWVSVQTGVQTAAPTGKTVYKTVYQQVYKAVYKPVYNLVALMAVAGVPPTWGAAGGGGVGAAVMGET